MVKGDVREGSGSGRGGEGEQKGVGCAGLWREIERREGRE